MGAVVALVLNEPKVGDLWEAEGRLFWLVSITPIRDDDPYEWFEYIEISSDTRFLRSRLTIRFAQQHGFADLWKKLA